MTKTRSLQLKKNIALVAHDKKKEDLLNWAKENKEVLKSHTLIATGSTGELIEKELDIAVTKLLSGPLGGDQQLGSMIANKKSLSGFPERLLIFEDNGRNNLPAGKCLSRPKVGNLL
jgi:methylglyoxal synthase